MLHPQNVKIGIKRRSNILYYVGNKYYTIKKN